MRPCLQKQQRKRSLGRWLVLSWLLWILQAHYSRTRMSHTASLTVHLRIPRHGSCQMCHSCIDRYPRGAGHPLLWQLPWDLSQEAQQSWPHSVMAVTRLTCSVLPSGESSDCKDGTPTSDLSYPSVSIRLFLTEHIVKGNQEAKGPWPVDPLAGALMFPGPSYSLPKELKIS